MEKKGISVYDPSDPLERAIQDSYYKIHGEWLGAYPCQTIARAIGKLKSLNDWLDNPDLLEQRVSYFFAPYMSRQKDFMVFLTHLLFLRDILENSKINDYLHGPITFVTRPLAHYLFREYPIHIHVKVSTVKGYNDVDWVDLGGLLISDRDISLEHDAILRIIATQQQDQVHKMLLDINGLPQKSLNKSALTMVSPGVFKNDFQERNLMADDIVWDKNDKEQVLVKIVEPGDTGLIWLEYNNGATVSIPKISFDERYVSV